MNGLWKDLYSWASVQPMLVKLGIGIILTVGVLYVFGWVLSILFWFYLRATEEQSTRHKIRTEDRDGV